MAAVIVSAFKTENKNMARRKQDAPVFLPFLWLTFMGILAIFSFHHADIHWILANIGAMIFILPFIALVGFIVLRCSWKEEPFQSILWAAALIALPIYGYTHFVEKSSHNFPPKAGLRVATFNVDFYAEDTAAIDSSLQTLKDLNPDVLSLLEVNEHWLSRLPELEENYPYTYKALEDQERGGAGIVVLFSKYPLEETEIHNDGHVLHHKIKLTENDIYNLIQLDPMPPISRALVDERTASYDTVLELDLNQNIFVLGDFNAVSWQSDMQRLITKFKLSNATKNWPSWPSILPVVPLDNILVSQPIHSTHSSHVCTKASDHCIIYADLVNYLK